MSKIKVTHVGTRKNFDGLVDFTVNVSTAVTSKGYTFILKSERDAEMVLFLLKRRWYGKALVYLKKAALKEVEHG